MKKKGMVIASLTKVILLLITFVSLVFVLGYAFLVMNKATDREICKFSLLAATKSKVFGDPTFKVDCKRHYVVLEEIELRKQKETDVNKEVFKFLQREYYECYNMIPESLWNRERPHSSLGGDPWTELQYKNNICLVCSVIDFSDEIQTYYESEEHNLNGFNTYLLNNPDPGTGKSLHKVLHNAEPTKKDYDFAAMLDQNPIDPSRTYVIVIRWEAEGMFLNTYQMIHSAACFFEDPDEDPWYCSKKHPIIAMLPIEYLGNEMGRAEPIEVDGEPITPNKNFCSVLWN